MRHFATQLTRPLSQHSARHLVNVIEDGSSPVLISLEGTVARWATGKRLPPQATAYRGRAVIEKQKCTACVHVDSRAIIYTYPISHRSMYMYGGSTTCRPSILYPYVLHRHSREGIYLRKKVPSIASTLAILVTRSRTRRHAPWSRQSLGNAMTPINRPRSHLLIPGRALGQARGKLSL